MYVGKLFLLLQNALAAAYQWIQDIHLVIAAPWSEKGQTTPAIVGGGGSLGQMACLQRMDPGRKLGKWLEDGGSAVEFDFSNCHVYSLPRAEWFLFTLKLGPWGLCAVRASLWDSVTAMPDREREREVETQEWCKFNGRYAIWYVFLNLDNYYRYMIDRINMHQQLSQDIHEKF